MDNLHRQYLDEMGIHVFSLRPVNPQVIQDEVDEPEEIQAPQARAPEPLSESVEAVRQNLKKQFGVGLVSDKSKAEIADKKKSTPPVKKELVSDSPQFFFCFLDYENISLMLSLDTRADSLPREVRQLCDDIVFALTKEHKIPKVRDLRWPMVSARHIQQTSEDARLILGEMIKQTCENLILFGAETADYRAEKIQGTYLLVESIEHYLETPVAKTQLWQKLLPLRKAL